MVGRCTYTSRAQQDAAAARSSAELRERDAAAVGTTTLGTTVVVIGRAAVVSPGDVALPVVSTLRKESRVGVKERATVTMICSRYLMRVAASAWVAGNSVATMDPRANCIGMVANSSKPCACRVVRVWASSAARSVAS